MVETKGPSRPILVDCIVPIHLKGPLTYRWPFETDLPARGTRLILPLGPRRITGILWGPARKSPNEERLKDVLEIMDRKPLIPEGLLDFIKWAASYYYYPLGPALSEALPSGFLSPTKKAAEKARGWGTGPGRSRLDIQGWQQGDIRHLSLAQEKALEHIRNAMRAGGFEPILLFSIT